MQRENGPSSPSKSKLYSGYLNKYGKGKNLSFISRWASRYLILNTETGDLKLYAVKNG